MYDSEWADDLDDDEYPDWSNDADDDAVDLVPCPHCGAEIYEDAEQCPICGEYVIRTSTNVPWFWKATAIILVIAMLLVAWQFFGG